MIQIRASFAMLTLISLLAATSLRAETCSAHVECGSKCVVNGGPGNGGIATGTCKNGDCVPNSTPDCQPKEKGDKCCVKITNSDKNCVNCDKKATPTRDDSGCGCKGAYVCAGGTFNGLPTGDKKKADNGKCGANGCLKNPITGPECKDQFKRTFISIWTPDVGVCIGNQSTVKYNGCPTGCKNPADAKIKCGDNTPDAKCSPN